MPPADWSVVKPKGHVLDWLLWEAQQAVLSSVSKAAEDEAELVGSLPPWLLPRVPALLSFGDGV